MLWVALMAAGGWLAYDGIYSKRGYEERRAKVQLACLEAHPVDKHSTEADFASANACFSHPAPPPDAQLLAQRLWPLLAISFGFVTLWFPLMRTDNPSR